MLNKLLSSDTLRDNPATTQLVTAMMSSVPAATVAAIQKAMATRHDFTQELNLIRVPTLIVTGQQDSISPPADKQSVGHEDPTTSK